MLALAVLVGIAELAGVVGWRPLASRWESGVLVAMSFVVAAVTLRAVRAEDAMTRRGSDGRDRWRILPVLPGVVLVAYAVQRQLTLSRQDRVEWFLGGDHVRHLLFVVDERATGSLTYAHEIYPRAWQTLITALWSASGAQPGTASGFVTLVDIMSTAVWLLFALLVVATGQLAATLAHRVGLGHSQAGLAGLLAGSLALLPSFLGNYQGLGFQNSVLAALLLAVVAREVIERPSHPCALLVCGVSTALMANVWQLLLPAAGAAFLFCALTLVRSDGPRRRVWVIAVAGVSALIAMPGMVAVVQGVGIGHATDAGVIAPLPLLLLSLGGLALAVVLARRSGDFAVWGFAAIAVLPALTGLGVAAWVRIPPTQYYPSKLIWHTAMLCLATIGIVSVQVLEALRHRTSVAAAAARVAGAVALALVVAYAFAAPLVAQFHQWSTVHGGPVLAAVTTPGAGSAQVVWLSTGSADSTITRLLLDYYRAGRTRQRTPQPPLSVAEECRLLEGSSTPTVLSDEPSSLVARKYGCTKGVLTVEVGAAGH